jgi:hypothetical protein
MTIRATMACGHLVMLPDGVSIPQCPQCGESRVARIKAPPPRFRGVVLGPCATYEDLPAQRVTLKENS